MIRIGTFTGPWLLPALSGRMRGPGGLYNLGNLLGLASGLALAVAGASGLGDGLEAAGDYLAGSASALAITVAMVIFLASGEAYHRAWSRGAPPDPAMNRLGDLLSGWGALALFVGLYLMGEMVLALASGLLHAAGKFGSALDRPAARALKRRRPDPFRTAVLASRLPALVLLAMAVGSALAAPGGGAAAVAGPAVLLVCYLLWAWADLLLFASA
jgi:hypothetical protein